MSRKDDDRLEILQFDRDRGRFGDRNDRGYRYGERRGSFEDRPSNKFVSPADGVWTHDLFQDEQQEDDKKDVGISFGYLMKTSRYQDTRGA